MANKTLTLIKSLLSPGYEGSGELLELPVSSGEDKFKLKLSGQKESGKLLFLSPGFGANSRDYGPLTRLFENGSLVVRLSHLGSTKLDFLSSVFRLFWASLRHGLSSQQAILSARSWIHREENRQRRLNQLTAAITEVRRLYPSHKISLAGHSFGSDTTLLYALRYPVNELYLFSPHPPGYLIKKNSYQDIRAKKIWVISGSRDYTHDGVGPSERLSLGSVIPTEKLQNTICLQGVAHMDFAYQGLGPEGWREQLSLKLRR